MKSFSVIYFSNNEPFHIFWSTSLPINQLFSSSLRPSTIKSLEVDENNDGVTDRLEVNLLVPLKEEERITSFDSLLFSEVRIQQKAQYLFDAVSYLAVRSGGEGMRQVFIDGNVKIRQATPLIARGGFVYQFRSQ